MLGVLVILPVYQTIGPIYEMLVLLVYVGHTYKIGERLEIPLQRVRPVNNETGTGSAIEVHKHDIPRL